MKKYFTYRLKKCLIPFAVILLAGLLFYVMPLAIAEGARFKIEYEDMSYYIVWVFIAACTLMPVWCFDYRTNKRSADLYYSLPINRTRIAVTHFLTGFITIVAAYTAVFWVGFIIIAAKAPANFALINQLYMYLTALPCMYIIYSVASFAFTRGNNFIDGLIFLIAYAFALCVIALAVQEIIECADDNYIYYEDSTFYLTFAPFAVLNEYFADRTAGYSNSVLLFGGTWGSEEVHFLISVPLLTIASVLATTGLFASERNNKAENCEQVSDSVSGYKILLPLYMFCMCAYFAAVTEILALCLTALVGFFATVLWKRTFKLDKITLLIYLVAVLAGMAAGFTAYIFTIT
ncbi:MAG: hypothetical protein LUD19_06220 [Clostridia bacterium]|nr:hypothetical protein [Clostridia bacterium]